MVVVVAISGSGPAASGEAGRGGARTSRPACKVELVATDPSLWEVRIRVGTSELSLGTSNTLAQELVVYPAGPDAVLVAYASSNEHGPSGGPKLWRVTCTSPRAEVFACMQDADFGHSALSPDKRTLLFTGLDGIFSLDLQTRTTRRLTQAPPLAHCDLNDQPFAQDVVGRFIDRHTLTFQRGGPCGYEAEWEADEMLLRNPGTARAVVEPAPRPPFPSVAIDASGGFWLADGLCKDRETYGRILFSADHGDHWRKIPVKTREEQPMRQVIADRQQPGSILVFSYACDSGAHMDPGWIYVTHDGGKAFYPIAVPAGIREREGDGPASEQDPLQAITAPDGRIAHLILFGYRGGLPDDTLDRWESTDAGRTWKSVAAVKAAPPPPPPTATFGEWTLTIRKDGLYRARGGGPAVRIYPKP